CQPADRRDRGADHRPDRTLEGSGRAVAGSLPDAHPAQPPSGPHPARRRRRGARRRHDPGEDAGTPTPSGRATRRGHRPPASPPRAGSALMAVSDAIAIGEDWISEHYFASDAKGSFRVKVTERRKEWDAVAKDGHETVLTRFLAARQHLLTTFAGLEEQTNPATRHATLTELYAQLRTILGYDGVGLRTQRQGPVLRVSAPGMADGAPLAIVEATAIRDVDALLAKDEPTLLTPYPVDEKEQITSVARLLSHLFVSDGAPDFALVLAGGMALVAEKVRWAEGRYLAVNLQLEAERGDDRRAGETDRALTCLSAESLAPDAEGTLWWHGVLEESVKHTVGVSKDLREGVRLSI